MKYLFVQYFCITNIYFKSITLSYSIERANNAEIDEFIQHLLTSQRFDELADKIAEKAVNKIKNIDQRPPLKPRPVNAKNNTNIHGELYRHRERKSEEVNETTKRVVRDDGIKPQMNKHAKINMDAFMKRDAAVKSDILSLKYKYLTQIAKKPNYIQHTDDGSMVLRNRDDSDKDEMERANSEENRYDNKEREDIDPPRSEGNIDDSHYYHDDKLEKLDKFAERDESVYDEKAEHSSHERSVSNVYPKEYANNDKDVSSEHETLNPNYDEITTVDAKDIRFSDDKTKVSENIITKENLTTEHTVEIIENVTVKNVGDDTIGHKGAETNDYDSDENKLSTVKKFIRKEGDKTFAFQSSPDYKEYNEEYEQARKVNEVKDLF